MAKELDGREGKKAQSIYIIRFIYGLYRNRMQECQSRFKFSLRLYYTWTAIQQYNNFYIFSYFRVPT